MKALVQAQISAASMGHEKMGTGHLLCGLCRVGDELTRCILGDLVPSEIEEEVLAQCGRGHAGFSRITGLTPHAQRILLRAIAYANPEKKTLAGVAHIWQELLYEEGCTALKVLDELGRSVESMRTALQNAVGEIERPIQAQHIASSSEPITQQEAESIRQNTVSSQDTDGEQKEKQDPLEAYARNLTQAAMRHELEPLIGREKELDSMIQILGKKTKNNPLLLGEPGVGKSAIAEGLAQRIADRDVPPMLLGTQIYALDLAMLIAGTKYRGEFEERMKGIVASVQEHGNIMLFIDELHTLIGAGSSTEGSLDAANILKPALARGELRVIGATTYKEYRKYIEKDAALARRFQRIDVQEPSHAQTLEILSGLRGRYENYHHVEIADDALISAVELSSRYVTDRFMPDKAIDLIDEAASMASIEMWKQSRIPLPAIPSEKNTDEVQEEIEQAIGMPTTVIHADEIAKVVSQWTGVPVERVGSDQQQDILDLENVLAKRVIGQNEAIALIAKALRRARAGLNDPTRPLGVFMLLGPSGVGKTELCKALSEALFGSEDALIRVDMSEYSEEAAASRLIGSPPGYVGYGDGGQLTDAVLKRPYSVVLFDEIEKAHPKIFSLLLQLLDDGQLTDSVGRKVNFKNTIIIMTSNSGVSFDMDKRLGFSGSSTDNKPSVNHRRTIMEQVKQTFRPEFLGRIDEMVVMNSLTEEDGAKIAALMLSRICGRLMERGISLTYDERVPFTLAKEGVSEMSGARNLRRVIAQRVEDPVSELVLRGKGRNGLRIRVQGEDILVSEECAELTGV